MPGVKSIVKKRVWRVPLSTCPKWEEMTAGMMNAPSMNGMMP